MESCRFVLGLFLLGYFTSPSHAAVLDINYTISDSTIGDGNASGTIRDGTTQIGTWTVTSFSFTRLDPAVSWTPFIETIASNRTDNSYGVAGVGIRMIGNATRDDGVTSFGYTLGYSLTSAALSGGYSADSVSFWGKYPNSVAQYGPAPASGDGGAIRVSGFSGSGRVSDPTDNLQAADGQLFASGENILGWKPYSPGTQSDWPGSNVEWSLVVPSAASLTYFVDYRDQTWSAANETTAFNISIIPEPSVGSLFLLGAAWALRRSRKI